MLNSIRVLVVDPCAAARRRISAIIEDIFIGEVVPQVAVDRDRAIISYRTAILHQTPYNLVVSEIELGEHSGLLLAEELKALNQNCKIIIRSNAAHAHVSQYPCIDAFVRADSIVDHGLETTIREWFKHISDTA